MGGLELTSCENFGELVKKRREQQCQFITLSLCCKCACSFWLPCPKPWVWLGLPLTCCFRSGKFSKSFCACLCAVQSNLHEPCNSGDLDIWNTVLLVCYPMPFSAVFKCLYFCQIKLGLPLHKVVFSFLLHRSKTAVVTLYNAELFQCNGMTFSLAEVL